MKQTKRGRPRGSSALNKPDERIMRQVADLKVANPNLSTTAALRKIGIQRDKDHHRLRRKWRGYGPQQMEAALKRKVDHESPVASSGSGAPQGNYLGLIEPATIGIGAHGLGLAVGPSMSGAIEAMTRPLQALEEITQLARITQGVEPCCLLSEICSNPLSDLLGSYSLARAIGLR